VEERDDEEIRIWKVMVQDEPVMVVFGKLKTENMFPTVRTWYVAK